MTSTTETHPDVTAFVADVRARLADLSPEERDDLLEGLEADLAEQLADGADVAGVLGDPASYAAELRAAAGLPTSRRRRFLAAPDGDWLGRDLDAVRSWWLGVTQRSVASREAWSVAVAVRPAWWVLRAWVAVTVADQATGGFERVAVVPTFAVPGLGLLVLAATVVLSVLVGQGRLWPGGRLGRRTTTRLVLLAVNVVALAGLVGVAEQSVGDRLADYTRDYAGPVTGTRGVLVDGRAVHNIYAYDASGAPITTGVQLFDGAGRPIALTREQAASGEWSSGSRVVGCPWVDGTRRLWNVFPLPERAQRIGNCLQRIDRLGGGTLPTPPLVQVPPVSLPTPTAP